MIRNVVLEEGGNVISELGTITKETMPVAVGIERFRWGFCRRTDGKSPARPVETAVAPVFEERGGPVEEVMDLCWCVFRHEGGAVVSDYYSQVVGEDVRIKMGSFGGWYLSLIHI